MSVEPPQPLPKPTIRSVEATVDTIEIAWEEPTEPFISYELTLNGNDPITVGNQETSYTFYNLQPDTRYAVELRVINAGGPSSPARSRVFTGKLKQNNATKSIFTVVMLKEGQRVLKECALIIFTFPFTNFALLDR